MGTKHGMPTFRPVFKPTDIGGCVFWLRADLGMVQSGGLVESWTDQASSLLFVPKTPTVNYISNFSNGYPGIECDGDEGYMRYLSWDGLTQPFTWIVVSRVTTLAHGRHIFTCNPGSPFLGVEYDVDHFEFRMGKLESVYIIDGGEADDAIHIWTACFDGASSYLMNNISVAGTGSTGTVAMGGNIQVGGGPEGAMNGSIAELIVYNSSLSNPNWLNVMSYLNGRYAIY